MPVYIFFLVCILAEAGELEKTTLFQPDACDQKAAVGDLIHVYFEGTLESGVQFDANEAPGPPFTFQVGSKEVPLGLDQGVVGMCIGERRRIVIPPELGYGSTAVGLIPANSKLIYEVELVGIGSGSGSPKGGPKSGIEALDTAGETALHRAADKGNLEEVLYLIEELSADVNAKNTQGETPLHIAAFHGRTAMARALIKHGANVNATTADGFSPLHAAARYGHVETCRALVVDGKADVNATSANGKTALHQAAVQGHRAVVSFLVARGIHMEAVNQDGFTALELAAAWGKEVVATFLATKLGKKYNLQTASIPGHHMDNPQAQDAPFFKPKF